MLLKVSDELLAKLGATQADAEARIEAMLEENTDLKADKDKAMSDNKTILERLNALEAKKEDALVVSDAQLKEILTAVDTKAADAAGRAVSAALAKAGTSSVTTATATETPKEEKAAPDTFEVLIKKKVAAGMSKTEAVTSTVQESPTLYGAWLEDNRKAPKAHLFA